MARDRRRRTRKALLVVHVLTSVGWLGAAVAYGCVAVTAGAAAPQVAAGLYTALASLTTWVLLPAAATAWVSGVVTALITPWGLWRHYWVAIKLVLTSVALVILVAQVPRAPRLAHVAAQGTPIQAGATAQLVVHALGGAVVLLGALVLSVFKPPGRIASRNRPTAPSGG